MEGFRDFSHRRGASEPPQIPELWHYNNNRFAPSYDDSSVSQRPAVRSAIPCHRILAGRSIILEGSCEHLVQERDRAENYFPIEARTGTFNNGTPVIKEENNISRNHPQSLQTERGYGDASNYTNNSTELNIEDWNIDEECMSFLESLEPASAGRNNI